MGFTDFRPVAMKHLIFINGVKLSSYVLQIETFTD